MCWEDIKVPHNTETDNSNNDEQNESVFNCELNLSDDEKANDSDDKSEHKDSSSGCLAGYLFKDEPQTDRAQDRHDVHSDRNVGFKFLEAFLVEVHG